MRYRFPMIADMLILALRQSWQLPQHAIQRRKFIIIHTHLARVFVAGNYRRPGGDENVARARQWQHGLTSGTHPQCRCSGAEGAHGLVDDAFNGASQNHTTGALALTRSAVAASMTAFAGCSRLF